MNAIRVYFRCESLGLDKGFGKPSKKILRNILLNQCFLFSQWYFLLISDEPVPLCPTLSYCPSHPAWLRGFILRFSPPKLYTVLGHIYKCFIVSRYSDYIVIFLININKYDVVITLISTCPTYHFRDQERNSGYQYVKDEEPFFHHYY